MSTTRRSVAFTDAQMKALQAEAERQGVSFAEVVRRIIDVWRSP